MLPIGIVPIYAYLYYYMNTGQNSYIIERKVKPRRVVLKQVSGKYEGKNPAEKGRSEKYKKSIF